jgi:hypothetical protein
MTMLHSRAIRGQLVPTSLSPWESLGHAAVAPRRGASSPQRRWCPLFDWGHRLTLNRVQARALSSQRRRATKGNVAPLPDPGFAVVKFKDCVQLIRWPRGTRCLEKAKNPEAISSIIDLFRRLDTA